MTRKNLAGIPAKKASEIIGADLQGDMIECDDKPTLEGTQELLKFLTGAGRYKKDLGGVDLSTGLKNVCRSSINKAKDAVLAITRPGFEVKSYVHNPKGKVAGAKSSTSSNSSLDVRTQEGILETMEARKAHPDAIATQNSSVRVSGVDTSVQAAKLVGEAQKVPRCGICTMPMGQEAGTVCSRCK